MRAVRFINWDKVRDWLAQAGCACSGYFAEYEALRPRPHPHSLADKNLSHSSLRVVRTIKGREL